MNNRRLEKLSQHLQPCKSASYRLTTNSCSAGNVIDVMRAEGIEIATGEITKASTMETLTKWHEGVQAGFNGDFEKMMGIMEEVLADDVLFLAPTYFKERRDKQFLKFALVGVSNAFKNFKYTRAFLSNNGFALEFQCNVVDENDPKSFLRGIDLVTLNEQGKISKLEVMARPPKPVLKLLEFQTNFLREAGIIPPAKQ